jgi:hypothetical protein
MMDGALDFLAYVTQLQKTDAILRDVESKLSATERHIKLYPGLFTWWRFLESERHKLLAQQRLEATRIYPDVSVTIRYPLPRASNLICARK